VTDIKFIIGNWKMHGSPQTARELAVAVRATPGVEVVLCPPAIFIPEVAAAVAKSEVKVGAQDCHSQAEGAYTGDISAAMLKNAGCDYVIVGHSERRAQHQETNEQVKAKAAAAQAAGLVPVICVGETEGERDAGRAEAV